MAQRKRRIKEYTLKKLQVDPLYSSYWYTKFQNKLMFSGKKYILDKIMIKMFYKFSLGRRLAYTRGNPMDLLYKSILKFKPTLGMIRKKVSGVFIQIPAPIDNRSKIVMSLKWIFTQIKTDTARYLSTKIVNVLIMLKWPKKTKNNRIIPNVLERQQRKYVLDQYASRIKSHYRWK